MPWGVVAAVAGAAVSSAMAPSPSPSGGGQQPAPGGQGGQGGGAALGNLYLTSGGAQSIQNAGTQSAAMADPFSQSRQGANTQLQSLMQHPGDMSNDPASQWEMQQGIQATNRGIAAQHMTNSGNAQMELMNYGQGLANQQYNNRLNQLGTMAAQGSSPGQASKNYLDATVTAQSGLGNAQAQVMNAFNPLISSAGNSIGNAVGGWLGGLGSSGSSTPTTNVMGDTSFYNPSVYGQSGTDASSMYSQYTPSYTDYSSSSSSMYGGAGSGSLY